MLVCTRLFWPVPGWPHLLQEPTWSVTVAARYAGASVAGLGFLPMGSPSQKQLSEAVPKLAGGNPVERAAKE